jgi:hypothetical protein
MQKKDWIRKRNNMKYIKMFPKTEPIVSMLVWKNIVYIATSRRIYYKVGNKFFPMKIVKAQQNS